jgi:hypothetical protein
MLKHLTHLTAALFLLVASLSAQKPYDTGPCGASGYDLTCTKTGDTLTVSGTGRMEDYHRSCMVENCYSPWGPVSKVVIGEGVTYIGGGTFGNSSHLKEVVVMAMNPPSFHVDTLSLLGAPGWGYDAFPGEITSTILRVPQGSIDTYRATNVWKEFGYINPSTVTFLNGDVTHKTELVSYGDTLGKPEPPMPPFAGPAIIMFDGWYRQGEDVKYDFSTPVTTDITLVAKWGYTTSAASPDRVITQGKPADEATAVAPAGKSHAEFTAGPNPASRSYGSVAFFRQGSLIVNASLSVYDAYGNLVRVLSIRDNAVGTLSKRRVGSWNLKDANGRSVPDGTYLVKGTITAAGGKSQSVSLPVGVR